MPPENVANMALVTVIVAVLVRFAGPAEGQAVGAGQRHGGQERLDC